jgi:hypothetical protein
MRIEEGEPIFISRVSHSDEDDAGESAKKEPFTLFVVLDSNKIGFLKSIYLYDPEGYENIYDPVDGDLRISITDYDENKKTNIIIASPVRNNKVIPCKIVIYNESTYNDEYSKKIMSENIEKSKLIFDSKYITNNPSSFFHLAEIHLGDEIEREVYFSDNDYFYAKCCLNAKKAARFFLYGYICYNNYPIKFKTRNLVKVWEIAVSIDSSFLSIKKECELLSRYTEIMEYNDKIKATREDAIDAIKAAKTVCLFPSINELRDKFSKKMNYRKRYDKEDNISSDSDI